MKTNKIQWKRISEGEELPCDSLLMRYDGTITRGTCAGVKAGQDAYYLPFDELKKLPKEESEDDRIRKDILFYIAAHHKDDGEKARWLYWLETQGAHKKFRDSIQIGDKVTRNEDGVLVNLSQLNRVAKKDEKQGEKRTKLVDFDLNANDSDLQEETYFIPDGCYAIIEDNKVILRKRENKPKFRVGDTIKCKHDDRQFTVKSIDLGKGTYTYTQDGCGNDIDYADEEFELVEQKPCMIQWKGDNLKEVIGFTGKDKNFEKWFKSFEEYEKYVHEHNDIFKLFNEDGSHYEVPVGAWIVKTPDGYNVASKAVLKQKPWSEEDEMMITFALTYFRTRGALEDSNIINWLKSLKDRVQPKQEWSEEDYNEIESIACHLDNTDNEDMAESLRSIRDKYYSQSTWKPSNGQIHALNYVVNLMASSESPKENDYFYNLLKDLKEQLKKLREE